jgi:V-type H+-transporting ATPase subunit C
VSLFRKVVDDFKNACREKKYIVREFAFDAEKSKGGEKKKLEAERETQKKNLVRWCKTNFSEAFVAWVHLKAIRVFVESVLRYGLPTNFQAMLLLVRQRKYKIVLEISIAPR